jgi:hypothetical protein
MNNKKRQLITGVFYVQDERYVVLPWMAMNDDVQDERYVELPWMPIKAMLSAHASK